MNAEDTRTKWLEELSGSQTLWAMLSSENLEDVSLAISIIEKECGGTEVAEHIKKLTKLLSDAATHLYRRCGINDDNIRILLVINRLQGTAIKLMHESNMDPSVILT